MKWYVMSVVLVVVGLSVTGCRSLWSTSSEATVLAQCIENTRKLDEAKEETAMKNNLKNGDIASIKDVSSFIPGGIETIKCPANGIYTNMIIGQWPSCSVHGSVKEMRKNLEALQQNNTKK